MIVCICNDVNDEKISETIKRTGATTIKELQEHLDVCDRCTGCTYAIKHLLSGKSLEELFG